MNLNENIFVPDNPEDRMERHLQMIYRKLQAKHIEGNLDLEGIPITHLGNVESVGEDIGMAAWKYHDGYLNLTNTRIKDLGNLKSVGGTLVLSYTQIKSLGNLKYVGRNLWLVDTPIAKKYTKEEIRQMVYVRGRIIL